MGRVMVAAETAREMSLVIGMPASGEGANGLSVDADAELLEVQEVARDLAARLLAEDGADGHEHEVARPCVWREADGRARLSFACGEHEGSGAPARELAAGRRAFGIMLAAMAEGREGRLHGELPVDLAVRLSRAWWMAREDALLWFRCDGGEAVVLDGAERKAYRRAATIEDKKDGPTGADLERVVREVFWSLPLEAWADE